MMINQSRIVPEQHILLKFISCENYAKDLLAGNLYMNSLEYFWNEYPMIKAKKKRDELLAYAKANNLEMNEDELLISLGKEREVQGQMDLFEGIYCHADASKLGFQKDLEEHLVTDVSFRAEGYRYCHVHCYYRLDYWMDNFAVHWDENEAIKDFGEYVVIIDDEAEFLKRIGRAASSNCMDYLCGSVKYREPIKDGKPTPIGNHVVMKLSDRLVDVHDAAYKDAITRNRDAFDKMSKMSYQKEWRIAVYDGKRNASAITLHIDGGISDIAHVVKTSELLQELDDMFLRKAVKIGESGYYGNISRADMREKFYALGDYKASMFAVFG